MSLFSLRKTSISRDLWSLFWRPAVRKQNNPFHICLRGWNSQHVLSNRCWTTKYVLLLGPVFQTIHCFTVIDDGQIAIQFSSSRILAHFWICSTCTYLHLLLSFVRLKMRSNGDQRAEYWVVILVTPGSRPSRTAQKCTILVNCIFNLNYYSVLCKKI